jgi:colicin import membrane protein
MFAPGFKMEKMSTLSVINVSMVTLPAQEKRPAPVAQLPLQTQKKLQASKILPKNASEAVSVEPKTKKSLKKETFKSSKMVKRAIKRLEKKVEEARPDQITQAIDRLKDQVQKTGELDKQKHQALLGIGPQMPGVDEPGVKRALELLDIYRIEVAFHIQKNWAFPPLLADNNFDLEAMLGIKILRNGEIEDIWFDKKSGNHNLDESAHKAIMKSNPLPPLPDEYIGSSYKIGFRFGPKGLK